MLCRHCKAAPPPGRRVYCSDLCMNRAAWERRKANPETLARARAGYKRRDTPERNRKYWERRRASPSYRAKHPGRTDLMGPECVERGCEIPPQAKERCPRHYRRFMKEQGVRWPSGDYASRARQFGVEYEQFDRLGVFARDGWTCQLCMGPVDRILEFPDPLSPSLDHIVPMSRGGAHRPDNAQLAHLGCNKAKGNGGVQESVPAVLALTAAGLSRPEIAEAVGVSVRTVAWIRQRYAATAPTMTP